MEKIACLQKVTKEQGAEKLMDQTAMCALLSADGVPLADAPPVRVGRAAEAIASKFGADPVYVNRIIAAMVRCMK